MQGSLLPLHSQLQVKHQHTRRGPQPHSSRLLATARPASPAMSTACSSSASQPQGYCALIINTRAGRVFMDTSRENLINLPWENTKTVCRASPAGRLLKETRRAKVCVVLSSIGVKARRARERYKKPRPPFRGGRRRGRAGYREAIGEKWGNRRPGVQLEHSIVMFEAFTRVGGKKEEGVFFM